MNQAVLSNKEIDEVTVEEFWIRVGFKIKQLLSKGFYQFPHRYVGV
jgi:hypothetical protein